jgi:hypothetical protein
LTASGMTSFPMPSPGITAILFFELTRKKVTQAAIAWRVRLGCLARRAREVSDWPSGLGVGLNGWWSLGNRKTLLVVAAAGLGKGSCLLGMGRRLDLSRRLGTDRYLVLWDPMPAAVRHSGAAAFAAASFCTAGDL